MARIRTIKPEFFLNEELSSLNPLDRLLFIGLWTQADREGRLEDRPKRLKACLFPYDDYDLENGLCSLAQLKFITRYSANGGKSLIIQINNFLKHQYPHVKEQASTIPAPCKPRSCTPVLRKGREGKGTVNRKGMDNCNMETSVDLYSEIVSYLNLKTESSYKDTTPKTRELIDQRVKEGFSLEDFKKVIDNMVAIWGGDPKMSQYLRPITIFSAKFEGYLNRKATLTDKGIISEKVGRRMNVFKKFQEEEDVAKTSIQ